MALEVGAKVEKCTIEKDWDMHINALFYHGFREDVVDLDRGPVRVARFSGEIRVKNGVFGVFSPYLSACCLTGFSGQQGGPW